MKRNKNTLAVILAILALTFIHTAVSKFLDFKGFHLDMDNQPFPDSFTPFLTWFLPITEISIVLLFLFESTRQLGLYISATLMLAFTAYTALVLLHVFKYVPCSCGGIVEYLSWPQHLALNVFLLSVNIVAIWINRKPKKKRQTVTSQQQYSVFKTHNH